LILTIQKNIEEKRLIFGRKLESFLLRKILLLVDFLRKIIASKNAAFFGCLFIIATSVLARSARDIGHDSALYLEIAQKMLDGGKYYQDFFESNFPLSFVFAMIPHFLAKIFSLHQIIAAEIFTNFVGILSLYFSARILARLKDRTVFNLIIISFAISFFWRVFTLQFNEFLTKSSYLLAFAFPYVSYHLLDHSKIKNPDRILTGFFAALFFCLKPHYGILPIVFELEKMIRAKSLRPAFCLRNYTTISVIIIYFLLLLLCFPDYIANAAKIFLAYKKTAFAWTSVVLREDVYPVFVFAFLCFFLIRENQILWKLFLLSFAAILIVLSEVIGGYDQRFAIYSLSLPFIILALCFLIRRQFFNFRKDWFFLLLIILIPQFDAKNIFAFAINISMFWWVFVLILDKKFLPTNLILWSCFVALAIFIFAISFIQNFAFLSWSLSAVIFVLMIDFYQKNFSSKKFSTLSSCVIVSVISYFIAMHLAAIFNFKTHYQAFVYKSPNHLSAEIIKTFKSAAKFDDKMISIAEIIPGTYPTMTYLDKINDSPFSQFLLLFYKIFSSEKKLDMVEKYQFERLQKQLQDKRNKLVFIETKNAAYDMRQCRIGFLENYFRDKEFKKFFLKNYVFLNRIIDHRIAEQKVAFFYYDVPQTSIIIERDVEVYIRK